IRTFYSDLAAVDFPTLTAIHHEMVAEATARLRHAEGAQRQIHLDLRYVGQEFTLQVAVSVDQLAAGDHRAIRAAFDKLYEHRYANPPPDEPVEMVNIRLAMIGKRGKLAFPRLADAGADKPARTREVYFSDPRKPVRCPVYERAALGAGSKISGPALIQE